MQKPAPNHHPRLEPAQALGDLPTAPATCSSARSSTAEQLPVTPYAAAAPFYLDPRARGRRQPRCRRGETGIPTPALLHGSTPGAYRDDAVLGRRLVGAGRQDEPPRCRIRSGSSSLITTRAQECAAGDGPRRQLRGTNRLMLPASRAGRRRPRRTRIRPPPITGLCQCACRVARCATFRPLPGREDSRRRAAYVENRPTPSTASPTTFFNGKKKKTPPANCDRPAAGCVFDALRLRAAVFRAGRKWKAVWARVV